MHDPKHLPNKGRFHAFGKTQTPTCQVKTVDARKNLFHEVWNSAFVSVRITSADVTGIKLAFGSRLRFNCCVVVPG